MYKLKVEILFNNLGASPSPNNLGDIYLDRKQMCMPLYQHNMCCENEKQKTASSSLTAIYIHTAKYIYRSAFICTYSCIIGMNVYKMLPVIAGISSRKCFPISICFVIEETTCIEKYNITRGGGGLKL